MKRKFDSSQSSSQSENVLMKDIVPPSKPDDGLQNISRLVISINALGKEKNKSDALNQTLTRLLEEFVEIIQVKSEDLRDWIDLAYQYSSNINELEIELAHVVKFLGIHLKGSSTASVLSADSLNQLLNMLTFSWNVSKTLCLHGLSNLSKTNRIKGKLSTELLETILLSPSRGPLWGQHHASLLFSLSILIEHDALDREINIEKITPFLNRFKPFRLEANDYRNILCFYKSVNKRRPLNPTIIHSTITSCVNNVSLQFNDALLDIFTSFADLLNEESVVGLTAIKADFIHEILERIITSSNIGILANQISRIYLQFARLAKVGAIEGTLSLELFEKILSQLELDNLPHDILIRYFSALELLQQAGKTSRPVSDALINQFLDSAVKKASQVPGTDIQCLSIAKSLIKSPELLEQNRDQIQKLLRSNLSRAGTNPEKIIKLLQAIIFLRNHRFFDNDLSALLSKIRIDYSGFPDSLKIQLNEIMQHAKDSPHWLHSIRQAVGLVQRPVTAVHAASPTPSIRLPSAGFYKGPALVQTNPTAPGLINNPHTPGNVRSTSASLQTSAPVTAGNEARGVKRTASHPSRNSLVLSKSGSSSNRASTDKPASWQNACQSNRIFSAIADEDIERLKAILGIRDLAQGPIKRASKKQKEAAKSTSEKPRLAFLLKRSEAKKPLTETEREIFNFFRTVNKDALIKLIQTSDSVFFFHLLKACTHHNRYFLIENGFFDEVFYHLPLAQLKEFIPHLEASEIYRAEDSIMHVFTQLNERGRKNPGEASSLKALKLEFFTRAREFHIDAGHPHLAERLNASIRRIEKQQTNLTSVSQSNQTQTISIPPGGEVTSFTRSTGTRSLFAVNTSYLYDSEDMLAILRARLETFNFATVIGVSQINVNVQGNRIKDQLGLILAENAALNASHKIVLVLPVQVGNHWIGLLLTLTGRKVDSALYLDSLGKQPTESRQRLILKELTEAGLNTVETRLEYPEQAIQQPVSDYTNCGPCLVENFHRALSHQWPQTTRMDHEQMLQLRQNHVNCLREKRPDYYPIFQNKHRDRGASFPSILQQLNTHGVIDAENSRYSLTGNR